ncbi:transposase [Candidatus Williamhamiltonella defendens]|uniref:transposase n=1 Tax=Candidatus Williamhamiltonella defendens TaxID=138072 RepID=UPI0015840D84|nr:transposase [Candidatus Hamiltonella defensa]
MTFLSEKTAMELKIQHLINDEGCYRVVRELRWTSGIACPDCEAKRGRDDTARSCQRYECQSCGK